MAYTKNCIKCGIEFETDNFQHLKCKQDCGRDRSKNAKQLARDNHELEFIAVDGEGVSYWGTVDEWDDESNDFVTIDKRLHKYVLLSVGQKSYHNNGEALSHDGIFSFLYDQYLTNPSAVFVGFFLGYDFTMWLKSLPANAARLLFTKAGIAGRKRKDANGNIAPHRPPWPVRDNTVEYTDQGRIYGTPKWEFDILGNKRFKLRPWTSTGQDKPGWMYINDTGPYFQASFMSVIDPKGWTTPIVSQEEYDLLKAGKDNREAAEFGSTMIEYNLLENEILARVMRQMNEGFVTDDIRLKKDQWYGPGQAAQAWMKNIGVPTGEEVRETVPPYARETARMTYYGGWFEIFNHGPVPGESYAYDINSAYPHVISTLPCLLHGTWKRGGKMYTPSLKKDLPALRIVHAELKGEDWYVGPMPHRQPDGSILRPWETSGWYWFHELQASYRAGLIKTAKIDQWVEYRPCDCPPPARAISELYQGRLAVGKNSPSGKAKKLVYNSSYGKFAQSVGQPKFSNSIYASLITAGCRTMILDAIATHPTKTESLLMIATDGIVFKERHPSLNIHPTELGAWDEDVYTNLSLFMPGLYWDDKTRQAIAENKAPKLKSRGVSARDMATVIGEIDNKWSKYGFDVGPPSVSLRLRFAMVSAKAAIARNAWDTAGRVSWDDYRVLNGDPSTKRRPGLVEGWGGWRSYPYNEAENLESTPYEPRFGDEHEEEMLDDVWTKETPDGQIGQLLSEAFRR